MQVTVWYRLSPVIPGGHLFILLCHYSICIITSSDSTPNKLAHELA